MTECDHKFERVSVDPLRHCKLCGIVGRGPRDKDGLLVEEGFFERATRERAEKFAQLRSPLEQRKHLEGKG